MEEEIHTADEKLVLALGKDDPQAFDLLFHKYGPPLYRFMIRIVKDNYQAEEAVQNIFFKIWEKRKELNPKLSFKSYLFTIAVNIAKKAYRDKLREQKYKQELALELADDPSRERSIAEYHELLDYVDHLIGKLSPSRRKIFIMSKKEGLKNAEIAHQLGISEQTVKNQLVSAKSFLLSEAKKDGNESQILFYLFINTI